MQTWLLAGVAWLSLTATAQAAEVAGASTLPQRMAVLMVQVGVLLFATKAGGMAARRLRQPEVLGQLTAGTLIGPLALGRLPLPGFPDGLFADGGAFMPTPELFGVFSLAAVVLLFMVGLETDLRMFWRHSVVGTLVGVGGVLVAFVVGDLAGVFLGEALFGQDLGWLDARCLFLGVVSTATAVGITARLLTDRQRLGAPEGVTTLAGAVVDDVLGLGLLAVVLALTAAATATGISWGRVGAIAGRALAIWAGVTVIGLFVAMRLREHLQRFRKRMTFSIMALALALVVAGLFERAGLALVVGAYVIGLTLSQTELANAIREKLEPVYTLLVPLFFGTLGLLVDWRVLGQPAVLVFALVYTLLAVLAKVAGCGLPALAFGFNLRGALRVGLGMVPRGEVALVMAGVGLMAGALPAPAFAVVIVMTILTTLCAPPVLALLLADGRPGLRRPGPAEPEETIRFPCANARQAEWIVHGLRDTLHRDGFFVHLMEHAHGTVLALRGTTSIAFRRDLDEVVFTCGPRQVPIVRTAVHYVLRELRTAVESMRQPLQVHHLLRRDEAAGRPADQGRDLRPFLHPDLVRLNLQASTGPEVLEELVGMVASAGMISDAAGVLAAVKAREESMSTGLERGLAVPHCRTDAVNRLVCAIGLKPEGIDFGAMDAQPSRVFVLTLSPISDPAPHVQFMSQIVQALHPAACRRLLRATSTHEAIAVLTERSAEEPLPMPPAAAPPVQAVPHHSLRVAALRDAVMVPRLQATSKEAAIDELLSALAAVHHLDDLSQVRRLLLQREHLLSTGLERGIAVPRCRTAVVSRVYCAIGLRPEGLDFGSLDGAPTQIVVLLLASSSQPTPYAQTLALLLQALARIPRGDLLACHDPQALRDRILEAVEAAVDKQP